MADLLNTNPNDNYGDDAIVTLSPREHIRLRPGMYIGKLGDGAQADDGIYVLIKEVVDNSVDEFIMGAGRQIDISIADNVVSVRDYGRGIPLKSLAAAVSEMNTGGKYGGSAFKKTVGLNGVGVKAVNMLSSEFTARSVRDGEARTVTFAKGLEVSDRWESGVNEKNFADFLKVGMSGAGVGGNLANKAWIEAGEFDKITEVARQLVEIAHNA